MVNALNIYDKCDIINKLLIWDRLFDLEITHFAINEERQIIFYSNNLIIGMSCYELNDCFCSFRFNPPFLSSEIVGYFDFANESIYYRWQNIEGTLKIKKGQDNEDVLSGDITVKRDNELLKAEFAKLPLDFININTLSNHYLNFGICTLSKKSQEDNEDLEYHNVFLFNDKKMQELKAILKLRNGTNYTIHVPNLKEENINLIKEDVLDKEPELREFAILREELTIRRSDGEDLNLFKRMLNMCFANSGVLFSYVKPKEYNLERKKNS